MILDIAFALHLCLYSARRIERFDRSHMDVIDNEGREPTPNILILKSVWQTLSQTHTSTNKQMNKRCFLLRQSQMSLDEDFLSSHSKLFRRELWIMILYFAHP